MSSFSELVVKSNDDGSYTLASDLTFYLGWVGSNAAISIPAGFQYDMTSTPRAVRWIVARDDRHFRRASALHDYGYRYQLGKAYSDLLMDHAADADGAPWWKRKIVMSGLKLGGWVAYRNHTVTHGARMDGFKAYDPGMEPPYLLLENAWAKWGWNYKRDNPTHEKITGLIPMHP